MNLKNGVPVINKDSWNNNSNLLFIDQPIGTGYSKAKDDDMVKTEEEIAKYFGEFLIKFLAIFPELKS